MVRRILVAAVGAAVVLGLTAAPSAAQDRTRADRIGDGMRHADIASVRARNGADRIVVSVRFVEVRRGHTMATVGLFAARFDGYYAIRSVPVSRGRYRTTITYQDPPEDVFDEKVRCRGLRVDWERGRDGRMRVSVPWRCLDASRGRVRVAVSSLDKQNPKGAIYSLRGDDHDEILEDFLDRALPVRRS